MKASSGKPREFRPAVLLLILGLLLRDSRGSSIQGFLADVEVHGSSRLTMICRKEWAVS
uniref:MHC I like leukocyte 2 n=1 Tax=Mus musculus TaxID=10090 RepID=A0A0U1RPA1_MOUSE